MGFLMLFLNMEVVIYNSCFFGKPRRL